MRYVLLDTVDSLEPGQKLRATKIFPLSETAMADAFAYVPTVPCGLLVEAMAQAGGVLLSSEEPESPSGLVLAKVEKAIFHGSVRAGERLTLIAEVVDRTESAVRLRTAAHSDKGCRAELVYFLARRSMDDETGGIDEEAFSRAHRERGIVLGVQHLLGGSS